MAFYETTFIARQDISSQAVEKLTELFSGFITQGGGKVVKNEYWGLRNLAYLIKKNRKGHYVHLGIDASFEAVKEMERNMRYNEDVIRSMTIRVEAINKETSPVMRAGNDDAPSRPSRSFDQEGDE